MLEDIHVFCAIAKQQSFAKAARELGLSTPVITRRLARLEKNLQTRLLNRTTRQVTLTEAGNLFYAEVTDILQSLEASKDAVKSLSSQVSGTLKVAMPTLLSQCYVIPELKNFLARYPNLNIQIMTGFNNLHLLQNGYDLVISCDELPDSNYYYKIIGTMNKVMCASPEYLQKFGVPNTPNDLINHNCLLHTDNLHNTWAIQERGKRLKITVHSTIKSNNFFDLRQLAIDGLGILNSPSYIVHNDLSTGKLIPVLDNYQITDYALYAVYPTNKYVARKTLIFIDFITQLIQNVCHCSIAI